MKELLNLLKSELESYQLIYTITQEQTGLIKESKFPELLVSIKEKSRVINTIKELEEVVNFLKSEWTVKPHEENKEIDLLLKEIYAVLEKNITLEKDNQRKIEQIKEDINKGLIDLNNINRGIKKYISGYKPNARFLDKKR